MAKGRLARAVASALLVACHGHHAPGPPPLGKALAAALAAADHARVPWRCAAADTPALAPVTVGRWATAERTLSLGDPKRDVTIGVVADAGGNAPATLAALARLRSKLAAADLVVTLGGMGTTEPELEATLGTLADKTRPLVVLPGDLEDEHAQRAAVATLASKGNAVFDGRLARWITAGDATLATIPGTGASERLVAGADGCAWRASDVATVYKQLADRPGVRIALLAEAPREGQSGELALVPATPVDVVVHGAAPLSPARQGTRDGKYQSLSPGTVDALPRLPETHAPSAGLLVIHGTTWSWKPLVDEK
ncbi:MAG: hypothetical protein JO257_31465 [Deltaproteobacteria bacterium]|nr:hypothetical protein [Deltaproteobacteria bacterium]